MKEEPPIGTPLIMFSGIIAAQISPSMNLSES